MSTMARSLPGRAAQSANYPFCAIVGQEPWKLALVLCAIDPRIGGVLVQGSRGMGKTTIARGLSELIDGPFIELPLGATEDRVTGSLHLERALTDGRVEFSPGLLARAHGGVLYIDEVNLLPDALVDLLLDAAATGQNVVERDGISHGHDARFVLVGSMNPDEGELRPQLLDRFGLSVTTSARIAPGERASIVAHRLEFEQAPELFRARFELEQSRLVQRCVGARALLPDIPLDDRALALVAERCYAAGVEGVRADLSMLRAARAHAAWHERRTITSEDIDAVAELALLHRRSRDREPEASSGGSSGGNGEASNSPRTAGEHGSRAGGEGDNGASPARPVRAHVPAELPAWLDSASHGQTSGARRGKPRVGGQLGARGRRAAAHGAVDWIRTLLGRRNGARRVHYRARSRPARRVVILVVDCSTSMLRSGGLAAAKGVAAKLAESARRAGSELVLISFRGEDVELSHGGRRGLVAVERAIAALSGGGGTPLRRALSAARALCRNARFSIPGSSRRLVVLSDGRTRESLRELGRMPRGVESVVLDCERNRLRFGRAQSLARAIDAAYHHLDELVWPKPARGGLLA